MNELQKQLSDLEAQKERLFEEGSADQVEISRLNARIKEVQARINAEKQRTDAIEEKVQAEAVPFKVAGLDLEGIPVEVITLIETVVKVDRRRIHNEHAIEIEQLVNDHFLKDQARTREYNELEATLQRIEENEKRLAAEVEQLTAKLFETNMEKEDAERKRDAAVTETELAVAALEQAHDEIRRLESEVADYQKAKVFGEREAQGITDVTPDEQSDIAAALENVKKLYTKKEDWGSVIKVEKPDGSFELVKRDEVEADWAPIPVPEIGGSESAGNFLGESQATDNAGDPNMGAEAPEVVAEDSFRPEGEVPDAHAESGLGGYSADEESEGKAISLEGLAEEFEALKRRVDRLEGARKEDAA